MADTKYSASTLSAWRFRQFHLARDVGGKNQGQFMTSEATLIAAGPARLSDMGGSLENITPIAICDNVAVNQNKMLQQIFEIGSRRSYFVSGRTTMSAAISRPMFNGPSLLRLLTASTGDHEDLDNAAGYSSVNGGDPAIENATFTQDSIQNDSTLYIDLQAEIFDRPLGLMFYMISQRNKPYGAMYIEDANVQAHAFNLAAQAMTVVENVSLMADKIVPVALTNVSVAQDEPA